MRGALGSKLDIRLVGGRGTAFEPETQTFIDRVLADGGTVEDANFLNSFVLDAKANNYWDDIVFAGCSSWGVKGTTNASDLYSLAGVGSDLSQAVGASQPAISLNDINGKSRLTYDGTDDFLKSAAFTLNQPESVVMMGFQQITWTGGDRLFDGLVGSSMQIAQAGPAAPRLDMSAGVVVTINNVPVATDAHIRGLFNGVSSAFQKDAEVETTGDAGLVNGGGLTIAARATGLTTGNIAHGAIVVLSSTVDGSYAAKMTALYNFSKSAYGTP